ncbi:MAG: HD family phosphohydrolase [Verrucomicrobiales bacterium]
MGFFDAFKRWRLVRQGLSTGQKRRTRSEQQVASSLDRCLWLRVVIMLGFTAGLGFLVWTGVEQSTFAQEPLEGLLVTVVLVVAAFSIFNLNHAQTQDRNGRLFLIFGGILFHLWLTRLVGMVVDGSNLAVDYKFLLMPMALAPMVHSVLLSPRAGVFSAVFVSLFGTLMMPVGEELIYLCVSMMSGLTAVYATEQVRKRGRLLRAGLYVGAMALLLDLVFGKIGVELFGSWQAVDWRATGGRALAAFGSGIFTGMLVSGILPALEGVFRLTTNITWLELSDLNHPLLRQMQLEAPGTFHHSLVVASLAEAAAEAIGAQSLMCRVCAYFHDIGKLKKPEYFIENQGEHNPHDALTPTMSALIIVAHVKDGVDLALKHKLNERIIEVIQEHHGDSLVYYFYRRALEKAEAAAEKSGNDDVPKVDEKSFRYPGPTPRSRESGIISLADAVESASRTIKKPTPAKIKALIDEIVLNRLKTGQLDECGLTMMEITTVKRVFAKTLRSMLHARIDYPKEEGGNEAGSDLGRQTEGGKNVVPEEEVEKARRLRALGN